MGSGVPRQRPAVQGNARPGEALHVRHEGIVIEVRVVLGVFLEDAEDAGGRLTALLAARYRRPHDRAFVVVDRDLLVVQRNDRHDRIAGRTRRHRLVFPNFCGLRKIARGCQDGKADKRCYNAEYRPFVLPVVRKKFHMAAIC